MGYLDDFKKKTNNGLTVSDKTALSNLKSIMKVSGNSSIESRIDTAAARALPQAAKMLDQTAELVFLFDKSGSCEGTEEATINGFKHFIDHEKKKDYKTTVTTILFDGRTKIIHDRLNIKAVNEFSYEATGRNGTALYDCICYHLPRIISNQKLPGKAIPKKTIVVIMTDGQDNSSISSLRRAQDVISECKQLGWEFIFLGNQIDAKKEAAYLGIDEDHAVNYCVENNGIFKNFNAVNNVLQSLRETGKVNTDWAAPIINNNLALEQGNFSNGDDDYRLGAHK